MAAFTVDQHQHLIRAHATQLCGAHVVGAAGVGLARQAEGRQQCLQGRAQFTVGSAGGFEVFGGQHIDWYRRIEHGARGASAAGDQHRVQARALFGTRSGFFGFGGQLPDGGHDSGRQ